MEIVRLDSSHFVRWRNSVRAGFGDRVSEAQSIYMRDHRVELERLLACYDGDEIVGTGGADSFAMTVPGGSTVPSAGLAYITTASTHRRRGIQRAMMARIHHDARERGDAASILWASMGHLYGKYGYGNAIPSESWKITQLDTAFAFAPSFSGGYRMLRRDEAIPQMAQVWERARTRHAGMVDRTAKRWQYEVHPEFHADDFFVVYHEAGEPRGYAQYVFGSDPAVNFEFAPNAEFAMTLTVREAVAVDSAAHAAVWRFLFDEPLAREISASNRPVDDPVHWMLESPRRLRRATGDSIWLKVLDVPAMLSARSYSAEVSFVLEVRDAADDSGRRWRIDAGGDGASCVTTTEAADVVVSESGLGAAYFGAVSFSRLAGVGEVDATPRGASLLTPIDAAFRTSPAAWNPHHF